MLYWIRITVLLWGKYVKMLPGVFKSVKKDGNISYRSSVTFRSKHISLGSFNSGEKAHNAYLDALNIINNRQVFIPEDYSDGICRALSFDKWVVLVNFKNNGIYIKTPIYLKKKFFYYYLSVQDVLIFDADDLFYYSDHSIMQRGGHLFVTEYGMQVNIASRYGIRNFARPGKDFRYENIKILNPYHGVTIEKYKGGVCYATRIHINGNFIVGRYNSIEKAAAAYNKAADILESKGIKKHFERNYIEDLPAKEYMELYNSIKITDKIKGITCS